MYTDFQRFSCFFVLSHYSIHLQTRGTRGIKDGTIKASTTMYWPS